MNKFMDFIRLDSDRHFIDWLYPFPNGSWMLLIEGIGNKLFGLVFLTFKLKIFAVETVSSTERGDPAGGRDACSGDNENVLLS